MLPLTPTPPLPPKWLYYYMVYIWGFNIGLHCSQALRCFESLCLSACIGCVNRASHRWLAVVLSGSSKGHRMVSEWPPGVRAAPAPIMGSSGLREL